LPDARVETSLVEREIRIEAEPEVVFPFFTDPERMVRWIGVGATLDPRPGGVFSLNTLADYFFAGEYLEVEPPRRIVFTWGYGNFPEEPNPMPPGSTTVEVELVPDGEATIVRLSHRVPAELDAFHAMGWEHYLDRLGIASTGGEPGPDPFREALEAMMTGTEPLA
jgi:uncharacterized protein YndB with AHSA1/START domain